MDWREFFKGKKVTQLGLGLLGRGVNDALFLARHGAILTVTDKKTSEQLAPSIEKLAEFKDKIKFVLGEHKLENFRDCDFVLKAAGVPLDSPEIVEARKNNIPIEMDASLFAKLAPKDVTIVGITGTRGKSTTTHLIYHILKMALNHSSERTIGQAGKKVFLGGNVKDMATLPLLQEVQSGDYVVLELDSWQLQGFGEAKISPHVAVFTTFMDDHLIYYKNDRDLYFVDKAYIFQNQKDGDFLIVGEQVAEKIQKATPSISPTIARASDLPSDWKINLLGEHNRVNIACAVFAARALQIDDGVIKEAVETFQGVPGRLELVREINGIKIYNDTTATTPAAVRAGLSALDPDSKKNIIHIVGGFDKGIDLGEMIEAMKKHCKAIVFLPGSGTDKLISTFQFPISNEFSMFNVSNMKEAVTKAFELATSGDVILLSPGFASFGLFKNEYDRGEQFDREVKNL